MAGGRTEHGEGAIDRHVARRVARSRGRPRDPETDAAILRAALDLFVAHGIDGTSIEQIARRAGVARLTVYRRWSTKEELLVQAVESVRGSVPDGEIVARALAGTTPAEVAERLIDLWGTVLVRPEFVAMLARLIGSSPAQPALLETYWRTSIAPRRQAAKPLVRRLVSAGMLPEGTDEDVVLDIIAGSVLYRVLLNPAGIDADGIRDYLRDLLRHLGFNSDPATPSRTSNPG